MASSPFTAVVVDDDQRSIELIRRMCDCSGFGSVVGCAPDGASALDLVRKVSPDVAFIDTDVPGTGGLEVLSAMLALPFAPRLVIVTANARLAVEAFDVPVVDYVLKPTDPARLARAIGRVTARLTTSDDDGNATRSLQVQHRNVVHVLPIRDVRRIEAERDYVRIHDSSRSYLLRSTLSEMAARIGKGFVRVHRSTLIARSQIAGLRHAGHGRWMVVDLEGREMPVGRAYLPNVRASLFEFDAFRTGRRFG